MAHRNDIRIARDIAFGDEGGSAAENFQQLRPLQPKNTDVRLDYSLRQYVSFLYKARSIRPADDACVWTACQASVLCERLRVLQ